MNRTALRRQSIPDMVLQECGGIEAMMDVSQDNDVCITDVVETGSELVFARMSEKKVVDSYATNSNKPATAITTEEINTITDNGEGIEFWFVEYDLIVT